MKTLFEFIQFLFEDVLFLPLHWLREMELSCWTGANIINWGFVGICAAAMVYWVGQLKKFNDNNEEDRDVVSHSFLGKKN